MSFLTAEWRKLAIANYEIDPAVLNKYVPAGTELDFWNGKCFVSLVGFMFIDTRLLGVPIPFHRNFEEVNLRFYVRRFDGQEWKRGVVFVKELVPRKALTLVANTVYQEHYETVQMAHSFSVEKDRLKVSYRWGGQHAFHIEANAEAEPIATESETGFITEHYWGYTRVSEQKTFEYEVTHPTWEAYPVLHHKVAVDFGDLYGSEFAQLSDLAPSSVMLAEGSKITVEKRTRLSL